jgi:RNA polymerase sigma-70 factor (ECF subfamily)
MTESEFLQVYDEQLTRVVGYCAFRLGSRQEAEDMTAEAFARLIARRERVSADAASAWLLAVAKNLCTDHARRSERRGEMPEGLREPAEEPVWLDPSLFDAVRTLTPGQQQVFFLHVIEDLPFAEVGRLLRRPEAAVKMQYHRAVRRLRRMLEEVKTCPTTSAETR